MRKYILTYILIGCLLGTTTIFAQTTKKDKGVFAPHKNEFFKKIKKDLNAWHTAQKPERRSFKMDFEGIELPDTIGQFERAWYTPPVSQGWTGTCWCFSTTSFFESEMQRQFNIKIKLSEMYTVYWEYVEKARRFVRGRGKSEFGEGSEANAVIRIWKKYGIVPETIYNGLQKDQPFHDHRKMFSEMNDFLQSLKTSNAWNEESVLATIKSILNHYMGLPPLKFSINGKTMTPKEYLSQVVRLNMDDYVGFMSLMEKPYFQKVEYKVPDNWWHSKNYFNIPLDDFMRVVKRAVRKGYTISLGGDVSEAGIDSHKEVAVVPSFDIPSSYIDENARQFRFSNHSTTDDHGIHLVGYMEMNGKDWYLIKDSGSGSHNGHDFGYYFYSEDYVKLKMMNVMVHKSIAEDILKKFKN